MHVDDDGDAHSDALHGLPVGALQGQPALRLEGKVGACKFAAKEGEGGRAEVLLLVLGARRAKEETSDAGRR